jgi:hypothetical protein
MAVLLLYDDPRNIYSRLKERDKKRYNMDLLVSFQQEETLYSESVANGLNIPYLKANPFMDREKIDKFVVSLL